MISSRHYSKNGNPAVIPWRQSSTASSCFVLFAWHVEKGIHNGEVVSVSVRMFHPQRSNRTLSIYKNDTSHKKVKL
jgi:hypothetical protein